MFVLSFKNGDDDRRGDSFDLYYLRLVEINDCNALIDNKPFFDQPLKSKQEAYRKTCQNVRIYTAVNLSFSYHQNYYKSIGIDLSRPKKYECSSTNKFCKKTRRI